VREEIEAEIGVGQGVKDRKLCREKSHSHTDKRITAKIQSCTTEKQTTDSVTCPWKHHLYSIDVARCPHEQLMEQRILSLRLVLCIIFII
jgi:hypothetical protein